MRLFVLIIVWATVFVAYSVASVTGSSLSLNIVTKPDQKGEILVAVFDSDSGFPNDGSKAIRLARGNASGGRCKLMVDNLPEGIYAVSVFQDRNGDMKFNTNFIGIPQEGYGVSNNALSTFRAPTFKEASFRHKGPTELEIRLSY